VHRNTSKGAKQCKSTLKINEPLLTIQNGLRIPLAGEYRIVIKKNDVIISVGGRRFGLNFLLRIGEPFTITLMVPKRCKPSV
jgi:hypothetical protein